MLRLTVNGGPAEGQVVDRPPCLCTVLTVGRTKASRVHIKDPAVSEKHGEIRWTGAGWELRDLGSSNGTKVNGRALAADGMHWVPGSTAVARSQSLAFCLAERCARQAAPVPHGPCM